MKTILFTSLSIFLLATCNSAKNSIEQNNTSSQQENINNTISQNGTVMLLGNVNRKGFEQEPFNSWFNENYAMYKPNENTITNIKKNINTITITAFMGTWCGDSKREVPRFYKIIDAIGFNEKNLTFYAVDRTKTTPDQSEKDLDIIKVPTFIFYKNGKEINRIVEFPLETLEQDILDIISGKDYKHAYAE